MGLGAEILGLHAETRPGGHDDYSYGTNLRFGYGDFNLTR